MTTLHLVGIDSSLAATGWAVVRAELGVPAQIRTGIIATPSVSLAGADYYPETLGRIRRIGGRLLREIRADRQPGDPFLVAFEGPSMGTNTGQADARSGLRWILYNIIEKEADAVVTIPPKSVKRYMTGNGNADKVAMVAAIQRAFPEQWITDDNAADALGLAAMLARQVNHPIEASVQRCHPSALNVVHWPRWIRDLT